MSELASKHCVPCEGGVPPMSPEESAKLLKDVHPDWQLTNGLVQKLSRALKFNDFLAAMAFVNRVAEVAEAEGHHPDIFVSYNTVRFDLFTHAIHGLSENDFILAAKIDELALQEGK